MLTVSKTPISELLEDKNLWDHQREAKNKYWSEPGWGHLWEPRTGKTRLTHAEMIPWLDEGMTRFLVTAPQTVCDDVWIPETRAAFPYVQGARNLRILKLYTGPLKFRQSILKAEIFKSQSKDYEPTVIVVNRDSLHHLKQELLAWAPEVFILDEMHDYKTPSSLRAHVSFYIARKAKYTRGLTGTLITRNYGDVYGQSKILRPEIFGTSQEVFQARYMVFDPKYRNRVIGYNNIPKLRAKLKLFTDIKLRSECFDIPAEQEVFRKVDLPPTAKKLYKEIVKAHVYGTGGKLLSVDHALARLTVLHQLAGGSLPNGDGTVRWVHDGFLDAAEEEVRQVVDAGHKIVVFYRFDIEGQKLYERLKGYGALLLNAHKKASERSQVVKRFQDANSQDRVFVVQEAVGSVGLSFAVTDYILFYSTSSNFGIHRQAKDRIFKPGAEGKLTYTYLQAKGTVHTWIAGLIRTKQNASDVLLRDGNFEHAAFGEEGPDA